MLKKSLAIGAALAIAVALFVPSLGGRSAPVHAAPPGSACSVNGDWFGFDFVAPPGSVTFVISQAPDHQNFTWVAYVGPPPPTLGGTAIAEGDGVVQTGSPDFTFHIEGHGIPNPLVPVKNVHADGTLFGCPGTAFGGSFTYQASYTNGMPDSSGNGVLVGPGGGG